MLISKEKSSLSLTGSVLIIALWSLFLLTIFAVHLGSIVRQKMALVERLNSRHQLYFIAEAGIQQAFAELKRTDPTPEASALNEAWSNNVKAFQEISLEVGVYNVSYQYNEDGQEKTRYGLIDEERKINLNKADSDVIARVLQLKGGLEAEEAAELAYAIVDWRDPDSFFQHPQYGAEDDDYKDLHNPYECKDAVFEVLEELLLVKGMTREIFDKIKDFVTIYPESSININTVSKEVLLVYGLREDLIDRVLSFRKGQDSREGTPDDRVFQQTTDIVPQLSQTYGLSPSEVAELSSFVNKFSPATKSDNFMVRSLARLKKNNQELEIIAVVHRNGQIRYWREEYRKSNDDRTKTEL